MEVKLNSLNFRMKMLSRLSTLRLCPVGDRETTTTETTITTVRRDTPRDDDDDDDDDDDVGNDVFSMV